MVSEMATTKTTDYWFIPKPHGYGATPANWKGWVATLTFLGVVFVGPFLLAASQQKSGSALGSWIFAVWLLIVPVLVAGFIWLARAKTDGEWGWRWGK
jgi:hypothetical protein